MGWPCWPRTSSRVFEKHKNDVDIFCLQEIWSDKYENYEGKLAGNKPIDHSTTLTHGLQEISAVLTDHTPHFRPHFLENYGLCTFVRKDLDVLDEGEVFVHKHKNYEPEIDIGEHARNIQYVTLNLASEPLTIINFHGLWNGKGKGDSEDRLSQSDRIIKFLETLTTPIVFCGDFNLGIDTESLKKIEQAGLRNLIREHGITSTRTSFYKKPERYADYVLVSEAVGVEKFEVLPDEVSDHAPLLLEIESQ